MCSKFFLESTYITYKFLLSHSTLKFKSAGKRLTQRKKLFRELPYIESNVIRFTYIIFLLLSMVKLSSTKKHVTQLKVNFQHYLPIQGNRFELS